MVVRAHGVAPGANTLVGAAPGGASGVCLARVGAVSALALRSALVVVVLITVITLLKLSLHHSVAAASAQGAAGMALTVAAVVDAVVALFTR